MISGICLHVISNGNSVQCWGQTRLMCTLDNSVSLRLKLDNALYCIASVHVHAVYTDCGHHYKVCIHALLKPQPSECRQQPSGFISRAVKKGVPYKLEFPFCSDPLGNIPVLRCTYLSGSMIFHYNQNFVFNKSQLRTLISSITVTPPTVPFPLQQPVPMLLCA